MRSVLVLFGVGAAAAAGYLASERDVFDGATLTVAGLSAFALLIAWVAPPAGQTKRVSLRPAARQQRKGQGPLSPGEAAKAAEQERLLRGDTVVDVRLTESGRDQIAVIKVLRNHFDLGLKEAKDFSDGARTGARPLLHARFPVAEARKLAEDVEKAGGRVEFEQVRPIR